MAYVYKHIRLDTNEVFYVGIGSGITYKRAYKVNGRTQFWQNITKKTNYQVCIVKDGITWEEACFLEKELIKLYGRRNLETGSLVNLTDGGEGMVGYKMTEEQKAFHRQTLSKHRSKTNEINRNLKLGKKLSKETIDKLQGRKLSDKSKQVISEKVSKPVILYTKDNQLVMEFSSIVKAAKYFKIQPTTITNNIKGRSKITKQGIWKLK